MCAIGGVYVQRPIVSGRGLAILHEIVLRLLEQGSHRGADAFGVVVFRKDGPPQILKVNLSPEGLDILTGRDVRDLLKDLSMDGAWCVLTFNRATPTTEYNWKGPTVDDVQPFSDASASWWSCHNGVVANDKEIIRQHDFQGLTSEVDSVVIPRLIGSACGNILEGSNLDKLQHAMQRIVGSFAIAAVNRNTQEVFLARNYRPLFMSQIQDYGGEFPGGTVWASTKEMLPGSSGHRGLREVGIVEVPPYSVLQIKAMHSKGYELREGSLYGHEVAENSRKALVIASSGLDSTVALTHMLRSGYDCTILHFQYKCKAQAREEEAIQSIARHFGVKLLVVPTDLFATMAQSSTLTDDSRALTTAAGGETAAQYATEWVPARNTWMAATAMAVAEAQGFGVITLGFNLEEAGNHPDNEMAFVDVLNQLSQYSLKVGRRVEFICPVSHMMKHDLVRYGTEIGAPLHLTWSCYSGDAHPCGQCGSCHLRRRAFRINKFIDPRCDFEGGATFWKNCRTWAMPRKWSKS